MTFFDELMSIVNLIKDECRTYRGMWMAYSFLAGGLIASLIMCVVLFAVTVQMMSIILSVSSDFFQDNPVPLFIWGGIVYVTYSVMKNVHGTYLDMRKVIIKGNR